MNRGTFWTAVALGSRALGQLFLTFAVVTHLDKNSASLWFVFASLGTLVQLLDLGLSAAVLRSASHLWAGVTSLRAQGMQMSEKSSPNIEGLKKLKATMGTVYAVLGFVILILGGLTGIFGLGPLLAHGHDALAWGFFCAAAALQLMVSERQNFLQGTGKLIRAQKLFCVGVILSFGVTTVFVLLTHSLLVACALLGLSWLTQYTIFSIASRKFDGGRFCTETFQQMWPNAWRTGVSRFSLAFIYHIPTLIISRVLGVVAGGQYGFTVQICNFLCAVSQVPMTAATPRLHELAAHNKLSDVRAVFFQKIRFSVLIYMTLGICIVLFLPATLSLIHAKATLLPLPLLALLLMFFLFENHRNNFILLVSAFNHFPFWKYDLLSGAAVMAGSFWALGYAQSGGLIAWLWIVQLSWNFWWPVREGLRKIRSNWREYENSLLNRPQPTL